MRLAQTNTPCEWLAENIFKGDVLLLRVVLLPHTATETNNIGVFDGCSYTASDGSYVYSEYWPSGTTATDIIAYVYDDPYTVYKVSLLDYLPKQISATVLMLLAGAGSTVTGQSGF